MNLLALGPPLGRPAALALLWVASSAAPGCGGPGSTSVPLYPSSGRVLSDGKPMAGVQVTFRAIRPDPEGSPVPIARTDQDGNFRLATAVGEDGLAVDGAPAGDYAVALVAAGRSDTVDLLGKRTDRPTPGPIDPLLADPKTSGLKATIKPGENALEPFDLKRPRGPVAPVGSDGRGR